MSISEQTLETLEFPKIRERLARHTAFSASRDLALRLVPSTDIYIIRRRLQLTSEARRLLDERKKLELTLGAGSHVRIGESQLEQVLMNLVTNARDSLGVAQIGMIDGT